MSGKQGGITAVFPAAFPALFLCIAILAACFAAPAEEAKRTLYVYTWREYLSPDVIRDFEEKHHCRVEMDYYDSNETIAAMFGDEGSGYDVITPVGSFTSTLRGAGKLLRLDHEQLPNLRYIDRETPAIYDDPEMRYSIPYTLTVTGIGYDKTQVSPKELAEGWRIFGNARLAGRMAMLNDIREVLGAGLKTLGNNANSLNPTELRAAGDLIRSWKKNLAIFDVEAARDGLDAGRFAVIQAYSGEIAALMRKNHNIGFFVPGEGTMLNSDHFVIDARSVSPDLAHAFVNHFLDPDMAARNMQYNLYFMPNPEALKRYGPHARNALAVDVSDEILDKSEAIHSVGVGQDIYEKAWNEVLFGND